MFGDRDTTGWERYLLKIVQENEILPYEQMVYTRIRIHTWEWDV